MVARAEAIEQTRRRIMDAAMELFAERPFDLVSLADVAKKSGIGLATVVRQFETKEQLFSSAAAAATVTIKAQIDETPENDLEAAVRHMFENYERFGDVIVRLLSQEDRVPAIRQVTEGGRGEHEQWVKRVFSGVLGPLRGQSRKIRFAQLMAATDVLFWKVLRRDLGLSRRDTETAMTQILEALCR